MKKKKGIILLYTLAITSILSILLMGVVWKMQNSVLLTKRTVQEIKSYWSARAGLDFAADRLTSNVSWPVSEACVIGGYSINVIPNGKITGLDSSSDSSFDLRYYKSASNTNDADIIKDIQRTSTRVFLSKNEIYFLSTGRCGSNDGTKINSGAYTSSLESVYAMAQPVNLTSNSSENSTASDITTASAAIYANGSIVANIDGGFYVTQTGGSRPGLVSKGSVTINSSGKSSPPNRYSSSPLYMGEGNVFVGGSVSLNGATIKPSNTSKNLVNYGLRVYNSSSASIPRVSMPAQKGIDIPAGIYAYIETPDVKQTDYIEDLCKRIYNIKFYKKYILKDDSEGDTLDSNQMGAYNSFIIDREKEFTDLSTNLTSTLGTKQYEPFFIPASIATTSENFPLSFEEYTKARNLSTQLDLLENAKKNYEESAENLNEAKSEFSIFNIFNLFNNIKNIFEAMDDEQEARDALKFIESNVETYVEDEGCKYVFEKIYYKGDGSGSSAPYFTIIKPVEDYDVSYASNNKSFGTSNNMFNTDVLRAFTFEEDGEKLLLKFNDSVYTKGDFSFQAFERGDGAYEQAKLKRPVIDLGNTSDSGATCLHATNIDIRGIVNGSGRIVASNDLKLEAGAKLNAGDSNWLALYAGNELNLSYISAVSSQIVTAEELQQGKTATGEALDQESLARQVVSFVEKAFGVELMKDGNLNLDELNNILNNTGDEELENLLKNTKNGDGVSYAEVLGGLDTQSGNLEEEFANDYSSRDLIEAPSEKVISQLSCWATDQPYIVQSNFRGLLYSNNVININGGGQGNDFCLEGIVICNNGGIINISGVQNVGIQYDAELSKIILPDSFDSLSLTLKDIMVEQDGELSNTVYSINTPIFRAFNRY